MFAKSIIDSDLFLDMPSSTQNLYFHLAMRADDDGFVNSPLKIMRTISCSKNDMDMLVFKQYVIPFESGICVIKHWKIHNYLRSDRYKPSIYSEEKQQLSTDSSNSYVFGIPDGTPLCIPHVIPVVDAGKVRLGKASLGEVSEGESSKDIDAPDVAKRNPKRFIPPTLEEVETYCNERENGIDHANWFDHYTANGWKVGKNQMKDWKAAVRTWERNSGHGSSTIGRTGKAAYVPSSVRVQNKLQQMLEEAEARENGNKFRFDQANDDLFS